MTVTLALRRPGRRPDRWLVLGLGLVVAAAVGGAPTGDFAHPSGFRMPVQAGPFVRTALTQYDAAGQDVSAGYNVIVGSERPLPIVATLYVYPRRGNRDLDAYFDQLLSDIGGRHGGARPEFRKNIVLRSGHVGRYAIFGYAEPWGGLREPIPLRSYLVVYPWGSWWVKWRATTPAPIDDERMKAIVELTETLLPPEVAPEAPTEARESDFEPRLALARSHEEQVGRLDVHAERPDRGAGRVRRHSDLAGFVGPVRGDRVQPVVGPRQHEPRRAVVAEGEPLTWPAGQRQPVGCGTIDGAFRPVLLEDVHPLRLEERALEGWTRRAHARSGRAESSAVRIRTTCCAVNRNIAASST